MTHVASVGLAAIILLMSLVMVGTQSIDNVKSLFTELFEVRKYNKYIRPVKDQSDVVNVVTVFFLTSIVDFDEQDESLTTAGAVAMFWMDENLGWNMSEYGNVSTMFIPQEMLWRPGIILSNVFEQQLTGLGFKDLKALVFNDGSVSWYPYQIFKTTCDMDITYFPFDTQTCSLIFTEWSYTTEHLFMMTHDSFSVVLTQDYSPNAQWTLVDSSVEGADVGVTVTFYLKLQRKPSFYIMNVILPVVMLTIMSVFTFIVPLKCGERASYAITVFLSLVVFLTIVASEFPKNSDATPLFAIYLLIMTCLSTFISVISVVQLRLVNRDLDPNPPEINAFYRAIHKLGSIVLCETCSKQALNKVEDAETIQKNKAKPSQSTTLVKTDTPFTWSEVMDAMDILLFIVSLIFTSIATVVLFIVTAYNPDLTENKYTHIDQ